MRYLLCCILIGLMMLDANAQSVGNLDGTWGGHLKSSRSQVGIPIAIRISSGEAREYIWDGRPVRVSSTRKKGKRLLVRGPTLNIYIASVDANNAQAITADGRQRANLFRIHNDPAKRPAVTSSEIYGARLPNNASFGFKAMSTYKSPLANFGTFRRKAPHAGLDFAAKRHSYAIATADGVVYKLFSGYNTFGCGNGLSIRHQSGLFSSYCHLESVHDVEVGDLVKRGQVVGTIGSTGTASRKFPHIHFEVVTDGVPHDDGDTRNTLNPVDYFVGCFQENRNLKSVTQLTFPVQCNLTSTSSKPFGLLTNRDIQRKLVELGFALEVDGAIGAKTYSALNELRNTHDLSSESKMSKSSELLLLRLANSK